MKYLIPVLFLISTSCFAQRFNTENGHTKFEASVPTLIPVKAENEKTKAIFDSASNAIAILMYISDFEFKIPLMQEHFNENYMETGSFPKATFQGILMDKNRVEGDLTIKGETKQISIPVNFKEEGNISISGEFKVWPGDFKIDVPKIVSRKMAEEISIHFNYLLAPKN